MQHTELRDGPAPKWTEQLKRDRAGSIEATIDNVVTILDNDPGFKDWDVVEGVNKPARLPSRMRPVSKVNPVFNRAFKDIQQRLEMQYGLGVKSFKIKIAINVLITRRREAAN